MKDGFVKTAAITPRIRVADPVYNAEQIAARMEEAFQKGAKLLVFPELCLTGYTCGDLFYQQALLSSARERLLWLARRTKGHDALVFVGLPFLWEQKLYNVAAALHDGKVLALLPKTHLPTYAEFYEARHFTPGRPEAAEAELDGCRIPFGTNVLFRAQGMDDLVVGCEICEDCWAPDTPGTAHAMAGATVLVNLSASDELVGKDTYREMLIRATSARLLCGYLYASAGDGESTQDVVYGGQNLIAENGTVLRRSGRFSCESIYADLDVQRLAAERRRMSTFVSRSRADYVTVPFTLRREETALERDFPPRPFVPADPAERAGRCEEILSIQAHGLKKRLEHTGSRCAVVGVSGGLDSALALLVTARAFDLVGKDRGGLLAVTMPCFGTTDRTYTNACRLAKALGAALRKVDIREAVLTHFRDIGQDPQRQDVTYENGQARERTQVLMDLANQQGGLVIGTGDMSELALGWATYNGDHMSMYAVNAGVPKTLVRHLVEYYADACREEELRAVLRDVLDTPVSPELLPPVDGAIAQKTEDLVGPYELHDFFLYYLLRFGFAPSKIFRIAVLAFAGRYEADVIRRWLKTFYRRFFAQQFKRSCLPDGPKVGSVAVSPRGDLRMPSDASAALWLAEAERL